MLIFYLNLNKRNQMYKKIFDIKNINRIAVVGKSATGKSTLSQKLADITGLPLYHIDDFIWIGKLKLFPEVEYLAKHKEIVDKEKWIIDGYIEKNMKNRLEAANLVIYLDYSPLVCFIRFIKRWRIHRKTVRITSVVDPEEKFSFTFFFLVIYRALFKSQKREIESIISNMNQEKIVTIKTPRKLKEFITSSFAV